MPATLISFRFRPRTKQLPLPPPPSDEDDSDLSSPEHPVGPRKSSDKLIRGHATTADALRGHIVSLPKPTAAPRPAASGRPPPSSSPPSSDSDATSANNTSTHANVACNTTPAHPSTPPSTNSNTIAHKKSTLIRRVTSKLHISIPSKSQPHLSIAVSSPAPRSPQSPPALPNSRQPPRRHSFLPPQPPTLPNSFVSREHREAALRERGLLPPRKDLSEQERERDARLPVVTLPSPSAPDANVGVASKSLAEKIREEWVALNQDTESDHALPAYSPDDTHPFPSPATPNAVDVDPAIKPPPGQVILDLAPKSAVSQEQTFAPPQQATASVPHITASRPSCSTSLPRLSTSLDVLPEEDDFEGPFTPVPSVPPPGVHVAEAESRAMTQPGIVISTAVDPSRQEGHDSPIKMMVEGMFDAACLSPLSCHGSGLLDVPPDPHSPRSGALDTCTEQRQDLPRPSVSSLPPRRHTTDTCDRPAPYPPVTISRYQPSLSPTTSSAARTTSSLSRGRSALAKVSSFSNLRRSVSTSFRSISTASPLSTALSRRSTDTGADEVGVKIRTPVSPTMHNRASLWSEMRAIEDPECRRLCEMAFLD